jgi:hypothetical protein
MGRLDPSFKGTNRQTVTQMAKDAHRSGNPQQRDVLNRVASKMSDGKSGKSNGKGK